MATKREREKTKYRKTNAFALAKEQKQSGGESTAYKVPDGFEEFKPEVGVYELDIVNFVAGKGNKWADEGMLHYESEWNVHWVPTIDGKSRPYCCLTRWKKRCPVCERQAKPYPDDHPEEFTKRIKGKTQHLLNVRILKKDGKSLNEEKFRVWNTNHYNKGKGFFEQLLTLVSMDEKYGEFADWEEGLSLRVSFVEDSFPGGKYIKPDRLDFISRKEGYDESVLENLCCLDDLFIEKSYDALKSVLENGVEVEEDEDAPVAKSSKSSKPAKKEEPEEEEEDEDNDEDEEETEPAFEAGDVVLHERLGRCTVVKLQGDGLVTLEDAKKKTHKNVDAALCDVIPEDEEEEEEDEKPAPKSKAKKEEPEEEEDEWESADEEEEKPAPKKGRGKK